MAGRERVFRAPIWSQLGEGSWPFVLSLLLPPLVVLAALIVAAVTGEPRSLWGVVGALGLAALEFAAFAAKRPTQEEGSVTPCSWIALGEAHIRLGMGFLRPRILFEQVASVDRGVLRRGRWEPDPQGPRARVRLVLREGWQVRALAYPVSMDPLGELTMHLRLAAARNQERLRFAEDVSDGEIERIYVQLEASYRERHPVRALPVSPEAQFGTALPGAGAYGNRPVPPPR